MESEADNHRGDCEEMTRTKRTHPRVIDFDQDAERGTKKREWLLLKENDMEQQTIIISTEGQSLD